MDQLRTHAQMLWVLARIFVTALPQYFQRDKLLQLKVAWLGVAVVFHALILFSGPPALLILLSALITVAGYFLPELLANNAAKQRSERIEMELADTLDQMTITVETGLGFDGAMACPGENGRGPLAVELVRNLQDIQISSSRRQAFRALSERTNVTDLRRFVRAVIQADTYGVSVAGAMQLPSLNGWPP